MAYSITLQRLTSTDPDPQRRTNWCKENLGEQGVLWNYKLIVQPFEHGLPGTIVYSFAKEEDAVVFALKFS
ncbi:MAG TPA: hypothetical protein VFM18_18465 [Methanosarcina sp.]|nr:hypothetical protein [Methanosarcina sp.]